MKTLLSACAIEAWGRLRRIEGGDTMLASEVVNTTAEDRRDATWVKYQVYVDGNTRSLKARVDYNLETFFGQLKYLFLLRIPPSPDVGITELTYVGLAAISECNNVTPHPSGLAGLYSYANQRALDIVDIATVQSLVGRIKYKNKWTLFDRSPNLASHPNDLSEE
ncbi:hypothetical protein DFP72DRAFT_804472 [Ephemerocybe angulata]|uniref:Uncharacterized protein n=1 Tax=Ephemerocybe angulata TaxID=980116 RepID=A0A8H6IAN9_9AGAR|nr:hypothetical protein DFP72DRAFT_804472 [Tulosesus angulatus]